MLHLPAAVLHLLRSIQWPIVPTQTATQYVSVGFPIYCLDTFLANGGMITMTANGGDIDIYDKVITLIRIH